MKRLLSLSLCLMTAMLSFAHSFEVKNADGKTIYYNITSSSDLTVAVTYRGTSYYQYDNEYLGAVTIPATVTYDGKTYSVTSIGSSAFRYCSGLTSVTIPSSVTSIGYDAFDGTAWYDNQPNGLVYAGKVAYTYKGTMPNDTKIVLKEGTIGIAERAFSGYSGLTSITIPNSVTTIGYAAFFECSGLKSVTIPNSVTAIGNWAFGWCRGLTSVTIPNSVTSIGESAFKGCSGLTSVTIPNSVTSIGESAFEGCSGLTSVTIPNSVTSIGGYAFWICSGLKSVTIGISVTSIGESAFSNCSGLTSVTINSNSIISKTYSSESNLKNIFGSQVKSYIIGDGVTSIGDYAFFECSGLTSITIPNSVTSIGSYAFSRCSGLTSITIPNSVTSIGSYVFYSCSGLTSVNIPSSVTSIGISAFEGCSGLTSVTIPNSVTNIDGWAFSDCSGLTSITIPNSVITIHYGAFEGCSGLTKVIVPDIAAWCNISFGNYAANPLYYAKHIFSDENTEITDLVIPNSVTSIGSRAFFGCSGLKSVTIPNSVTAIGQEAFSGCSGLTSITFPNSVTSIGDDAFYGTAWYDNQPNGLVYAGKVAYKYKGTMPSNTKIALKEGTLGISGKAFYDCSGLTSIEIPNSVTNIGWFAFRDCSGLTSVTFGNNVTSIGKSAFSGCTSLKSIEIPNSVAKIDDEAFAYCSTLNGLVCLASIPPACGVAVFRGIDKSLCTLKVPKGSKDAYSQADGWKEFLPNIEEVDVTAIEAVAAEGVSNAEITDIYDLNGRRRDALQPGVNIVKMSDGTTRKVIKR